MVNTSQPKSRAALAGFSKPQRFGYLGYLIIFLTFGVMGGWAAVAKIDSASVAPGVVALEGDRQVVQHLEGGIVEEILVREADSVVQGDTLFVLNSVEAFSNLERLSNRFNEARAIEARLVAEHKFHSDISFPKDMLDNVTPELAELMNNQQNILNDRLAIFLSRSEVIEFRIEQLNGQVVGLERQRVAMERRVDLRSDLMERLTEGEERGVIVRNELVERMDFLIQIEASLGEVVNEVSQVGVSVSEARLNLIQTRQEFSERTNVELKDVHTDLAELRESTKIAEDAFERTVIQAPSSGSVQNVTVTTVGSVIRPGETLLEIVPQDVNLIVTARISPTDIDNVTPGQQAEVRFASFNTKLTPVILGIVETVSSDVITPQNTQEPPYYLGRIRVSDEVMSEEIRAGLTPGMPADVVIVNGERTVLSYLVSPLVDAIAKSMREQ
jgi:HlyD family type I secretion membrane fusion protein